MAHTSDKACFTVGVFLTRGNKVLMVNHPRYQTWLPIGGHIEPGEDTDEALFREIKEEAGLDTQDIKILSDKPYIESDYRYRLYTPAFVDRHHVSDITGIQRDHVVFMYFGEIAEDCEPVKSGEHSELRWFTAEELHASKDMFKSDVMWYALEALRVAGIQK